jgi:hypothetical protein
LSSTCRESSEYTRFEGNWTWTVVAAAAAAVIMSQKIPVSFMGLITLVPGQLKVGAIHL